MHGKKVSAELSLVREHLGIALPEPKTSSSELREALSDPRHELGARLIFSIMFAPNRGVDLSTAEFKAVNGELNPSLWA